MKNLKRFFVSMIALFMVICSVDYPLYVKSKEVDNTNVVIMNDDEFTYHGDAGEYGKWGTDSNQTTLYKGDSHWSNLAGAPKDESVYYEFSFTGNKVELYGNKESKFGKVKVFIDGVEKGTFDGYSAQKVHQQKLWESEKLSNDVHTLKAVLTKEKNSASAGYNTLIDYAKVHKSIESLHEFTLEKGQQFTLPMLTSLDSFEWTSEKNNIATVKQGVVTAIAEGETKVLAKNKQTNVTEEFNITVIPTLKGTDTGDSYYDEVSINDSVKGSGELQFNYHGNWGTDQGIDGLYQGDAHWSDVSQWNNNPRNHYYTFKFTGRKIDIYGSLQPKLGIYDVYIDNIFMGKIDAYGDVQKKNQRYFSSPVLTDKQHELKVVMTGEKNKDSQAPSGFVDYVKVTKNVQRIYPTEVSLENNNIVWEKNMTITPEVSYIPENTNQRNITWEVDKKMIKVNEDGSLTPIKSGNTSIVAVAKGKANITIKSKPFKITIVEGASLGKADFISKNRRVEAEKYDEYSKLVNKESSMTVWQNDAVNNAAILLTKDQDVKAQISVSDFKNELGDVLSKENVEANFQKYVSTYAGSNWIPTNPRPFDPPTPPKGHRVNVPDVIFGNELDIPAHTAQPIWIKVKTPMGTKPGVYEGTITISLNNDEKIELKQVVEVLEVSLDSKNDYYLNLWQYPYSSSEYYNVETFSEEHFAIVKNQMKPYMDAGGKTGTASIIEEPWYHQTYCDYPSMVKWHKNNGKWEFDYTDFDKWVSFLLNEIKVSYVECYSIVPWENRLQFTEDGEVKVQTAAPGTEEWNDAWGHFLKDFAKHLDKKGWFDKMIIAMDERPMDQMNAALNLIESIPNKDGHTFKVGGAVGSYNKKVWDRLFTVTPHIGNINAGNIPLEKMRQLADERRKEGKLTSIYTMIHDYPGMFSLSDPAESAWTIWFAEYCNTDGFLRWAYDAWVENPLEDNAHPYFESGDMFFVYPGDYKGKATQTRTSPRFEMMSEAIKDVRKLRQMSESSEEMKAKVTKLIDSVKSFYGKGYSNGIGSAGFVTGSKRTKSDLSNEVDRLHQETIKLSKEYEATVLKKADYSKLNAQVEKAKSLNRNLYIEESLLKVDAIIDSIVYDLTAAHQDKVDKMTENLIQAMNDLIYKKADYSKVDEAVKKANALNRAEYKDFTKVDAAIKAIDRDKDITKQAEVDAMANAIEKAIQELEKNPKPTPLQPSKEVIPMTSLKPSISIDSNKQNHDENEKIPNTGVSINMILLWSSVLGTGIFMLEMNKKRKKHSK